MPLLILARFSLFALTAAAWLFGTAQASAQPLGRAVVVPFFTGDSADPALDLATEVDAALRAKRFATISLHDARDRFASRSRAPQTASLSDIDALAKEAQSAIEHVAFGRTAAAQRSVRHIIELAERGLETLNRETATARTLLDACLALVRASLHDNKRDDAIEQAMRCRRLVPDLAPSEVAHPATVIGALAEADDQLRRMRVGSLNVQAQPERGCEVYLNGRHLGRTPFSLDRAPVGEYRVQVECATSKPGRVHIVQLGDEPAQITVDSAFDNTVQTDSRLALRYAGGAQARAALLSHAALVGREVRAEDVILVGLLDERVTLLRVQVRHQRLIAGAVADAGALGPSIDALSQARFDGVRPEDFRVREASPSSEPAANASTKSVARVEDAPTRASTEPPPAVLAEPSSPSQSSRGLRIAGGVLGAAGVTTLATSFGLQVRATRLRDDAQGLPPNSEMWPAAQQKYDDFRLYPLVGLAGSALATAAVPMLMPHRAPRGPAGWVGGALAGAIGIALIAVGAVQARDDVVFGTLLTSVGAPLITVPITQLVRAR
jgi:hypothetical protein